MTLVLDATIPVKSNLSHLLLSKERRTGVANTYCRYTVAVMKEEWVYHMDEKLKSRNDPAHFQSGRESILRMFLKCFQ